MNNKKSSTFNNLNSLSDSINRFFKNITSKLRFSISYRISANYFKLLFSSLLLILLLTTIIYTSINGWGIKEEQDIILEEVNNDLSETELISGRWTEKYPNYKMIVFDNEEEPIYSNYKWSIKANWNLFYYDEDSKQYYFVRRHKFKIDDETYYIKLFKDITILTENLFLLLVFIFLIDIIRIYKIIKKGSKLNKDVLKPIQDITETTQAISEYNMNLRINVEGAKYELKDLAKTINHMLDRIETAYYKQQQFVSDASHELRTPISVIKGYTNMLSRWGKEDKEVLDESIAALQNESDNMQELVEKLLFLARHDKQTLKMNMEDVDIQDLLKELVKETIMIQKKHQIIDEITDNAIIYGDKNSIKQVVRIFIDNAIKYTDEGGRITVKGKIQKNYYMITISDTGIGIAREELKRIFDRFYRTDTSRHKFKNGHGLGLAIARLIVSSHGGKIKVRSKVGIGSEFIIYLKRKK